MSSPSTNLTVTSKKLIASFEYSVVNFIVGWKVFNLLRNFSRGSSPCSQIKKISSTYLYHIISFSSKAFRMFSSKSAINKTAYGGANFVPIAVPRTCLKVFWSNSKGCFFLLFSEFYEGVTWDLFVISQFQKLRREFRPLLCGMLG